MSSAGTGSTSAVGSNSTATTSAKVLRKNAPGNRSDVGWAHGFPVDGDIRRVKCKYCEKIITGGVYRFKHHLAGTHKEVGPCRAVPDDVRKQMWDTVVGLQQNLIKKSHELVGGGSTNEESAGVGEKRKGKDVESPTLHNIFKKRGVSTQATMNQIYKKDQREEACQDIASFFYNNAIPFNVANSEEFHKMLASVANHGPGFKPPSYHEIRVKYLKQKVDATKELIEEHRAYWKKWGCTLMTDGWTNRRRRTILNFLVNSPKGTVFLKSIDASNIVKTADNIFKMLDDVVEEVGEENVVHVVTDNATNYKAAGEMLMQKRKRLYWTPCAAHCIDLMLEDFEKKLKVHKDAIQKGKKITTYIYSKTFLITLLQHFTNGKELIRPAVTRFATSYLTLGCLHDNKGPLQRMFVSKEWKSSRFAKEKDGKFVENLVMDSGFWKDVLICLKAAYPLIKVLRMVDSEEKPAMGFIYEEMDRAKEAIQNAFNGAKKSYLPIWRIIDERWDRQLHRPLHAAGYYLNPQLQYAPNFKADLEVKHGLYDCLERMEDDEDMAKIDKELEAFKNKEGFFGSKVAMAGIYNKTPTQWWESYGDEHPELQRFAIRVLSLRCSSSGCERNWSPFERVHTKKRNHLKQKTMNDVVFVLTNSQLVKKKKARKAMEYTFDDLPSIDEWIANQEREDGEDGYNLNIDVAAEDYIIELEEDGEACASADNLEIPMDEDNEVDVHEDDDHAHLHATDEYGNGDDDGDGGNTNRDDHHDDGDGNGDDEDGCGNDIEDDYYDFGADPRV